MSLVIVDSGVANLTSVEAACERLGIAAFVTDKAKEIQSADHVILPGVGSAPAAMRMLETRGLVAVLKTLTQPVLGICLGMQLLFESSEEGGATPCLGLVPGAVRKLKSGPGEPIPHMGWNEIQAFQKDHPLLQGVAEGSFMYFVHSFAASVGPATVARCTYGETFSALCGHKNVFGCQFHPERSGEVGQRILRNFVGIKN